MFRTLTVPTWAKLVVLVAIALTLRSGESYAQKGKSSQQQQQIEQQIEQTQEGKSTKGTSTNSTDVFTSQTTNDDDDQTTMSNDTTDEILSDEDGSSEADEDEQIVTVTINNRVQQVVPTHNSNIAESGDLEFDGHGPHIVFRAQIYISSKTTIHRRLTMTAHETCPDSSFGRGLSIGQLVYTAPAGFEIFDLVDIDDDVVVDYVDDDHSADTFQTPYGQVTCYGDQAGDDLSSNLDSSPNRCRGKIDWDYQFGVTIKPIDDSYLVTSIGLPFEIIMRYTQSGSGDREFGGNGPQMTLHASITQNSDYIDFELFGTAEETGGDHSEGLGYEDKVLYEAPPGYRIVELLDGHGYSHGSRNFLGLVDDSDHDHHPNFFTRNALGTIRMFGDHGGNDLNGYTRAELYGANYNMLVVLVPE